MRSVRTFYILTATQVLSIVGSAMTSVALGIRIFADTGDSTPLLLASFFSALPLMVGGSLAGVLVDRWPRRQVLIASDAGQALATLLLLLSFWSGRFAMWHLYAVSLVHGLLAMLQRPAMEASVTMLVPEGHRDRANAIRQITGPAAGMFAPVIAGFAYAVIGVTGVMLIDLFTFVVAIVVVGVISIPQPKASQLGQVARGSVWSEMKGGLRFLWSRPILLALMVYAAILNFLLTGPTSLNTPYIMTLVGDEETLGVLLGVFNVGIVAGGVVMSVWGGTRPRIHGIMIGLIFRGVWLLVYGLARTPWTLGLALFFLFFSNALVDASFMSVLQQKVPPDMQGRVFALLFQMMYVANPLALLLTGPLVDRVLEPAVSTPGWAVVAPLVGEEAGSGMGLLIVVAGGLIVVMTAAVYAFPKTRSMEADLPDYTS